MTRSLSLVEHCWLSVSLVWWGNLLAWLIISSSIALDLIDIELWLALHVSLPSSRPIGISKWFISYNLRIRQGMMLISDLLSSPHMTLRVVYNNLSWTFRNKAGLNRGRWLSLIALWFLQQVLLLETFIGSLTEKGALTRSNERCPIDLAQEIIVFFILSTFLIPSDSALI